MADGEKQLDGMPPRLTKARIAGSFLIDDQEIGERVALEDGVRVSASFIVTKAGTEIREGVAAPFVVFKLDDAAESPTVRITS